MLVLYINLLNGLFFSEKLVKIPDNLVDILNRTSIIDQIVRKVKNIWSITHVIKDVGKPSFRMKGSMEAVEKARKIFDISTVCVHVPDRLVQVMKSVHLQYIVDDYEILIAVIKVKNAISPVFDVYLIVDLCSS